MKKFKINKTLSRFELDKVINTFTDKQLEVLIAFLGNSLVAPKGVLDLLMDGKIDDEWTNTALDSIDDIIDFLNELRKLKRR